MIKNYLKVVFIILYTVIILFVIAPQLVNNEETDLAVIGGLSLTATIPIVWYFLIKSIINQNLNKTDEKIKTVDSTDVTND